MEGMYPLTLLFNINHGVILCAVGIAGHGLPTGCCRSFVEELMPIKDVPDKYVLDSDEDM